MGFLKLLIALLPHDDVTKRHARGDGSPPFGHSLPDDVGDDDQLKNTIDNANDGVRYFDEFHR